MLNALSFVYLSTIAFAHGQVAEDFISNPGELESCSSKQKLLVAAVTRYCSINCITWYKNNHYLRRVANGCLASNLDTVF